MPRPGARPERAFEECSSCTSPALERDQVRGAPAHRRGTDVRVSCRLSGNDDVLRELVALEAVGVCAAFEGYHAVRLGHLHCPVGSDTTGTSRESPSHRSGADIVVQFRTWYGAVLDILDYKPRPTLGVVHRQQPSHRLQVGGLASPMRPALSLAGRAESGCLDRRGVEAIHTPGDGASGRNVPHALAVSATRRDDFPAAETRRRPADTRHVHAFGRECSSRSKRAGRRSACDPRRRRLPPSHRCERPTPCPTRDRNGRRSTAQPARAQTSAFAGAKRASRASEHGRVVLVHCERARIGHGHARIRRKAAVTKKTTSPDRRCRAKPKSTTVSASKGT